MEFLSPAYPKESPYEILVQLAQPGFTGENVDRQTAETQQSLVYY